MKPRKAWIEGKPRVGPWQVRWRELVDGVIAKKASGYFTDKPAAEAERDAVNQRLAKMAPLDRRTRAALLPVREIHRRWRAAALAVGDVRETYAYEVEVNVVRLCEAQQWTTTADISAAAIEQWRAGRGSGHFKPTKQLKALLRWARDTLHQPVAQGVLDLPVRKPRQRTIPPLLTDEQMAAIIARAATFGKPCQTLVQHLSTFGCRPIDLCRMDVGDWDIRTRTLTLRETKNGDTIAHPITGPYAAHAKRLDDLARGRGPDEPLFISPHGARWVINATGVARQLIDWYWTSVTCCLPSIAVEQRGIYCLKDYAITMMELAGVDDSTKGLFTGQKSVSTFQRYKSTNRARAEAALERLGAQSARTRAESRADAARTGKKAGRRPDHRQSQSRMSPVKSTRSNRVQRSRTAANH